MKIFLKCGFTHCVAAVFPIYYSRMYLFSIFGCQPTKFLYSANMMQKSPANSVIAKRRCLYFILIGAMFIIATNIGITALLLYYINLSKVSAFLNF